MAEARDILVYKDLRQNNNILYNSLRLRGLLEEATKHMERELTPRSYYRDFSDDELIGMAYLCKKRTGLYKKRTLREELIDRNLLDGLVFEFDLQKEELENQWREELNKKIASCETLKEFKVKFLKDYDKIRTRNILYLLDSLRERRKS